MTSTFSELPSRLESLESGFKFYNWASRGGDALDESMALFFAKAGLNWNAVKSSKSDKARRVAFNQQMDSLSGQLKYIRDWFDVGQYTISLARQEASGFKGPRFTFTEKYVKYQEYLTEVMIPPDEIESIIFLLQKIGPGEFFGESAILTKIVQRLSYLARLEDKKSSSPPFRKNPVIPVEIEDSFSRFSKLYPEPSKVAFIMMRFGSTPAHQKIANAIKGALKEKGIMGLRADDKEFHPDLFSNVLTYIHGCGFGVAVFERIETEILNPNIALEVGYMSALRKPICLLKDKTLGTLPTDLVGKLYRDFDPQRPRQTIPERIIRWLEDQGVESKSA